MVAVAGDDPDRVLIVGGGPAAGPGAPDHDAALPGTLARALAARTGRGAVVEARGLHLAVLQDVPALVQGSELRRFDALIVFIGLEDGTTGVPLRHWRRGLLALVDDLGDVGARDAVVLLARIPPASSIGVYRGPVVVLADLRIRRMNRIIEQAARRRERVHALALMTPGPGAPAGSPQWYERCGETVADQLHRRFEDAGER